ncbi:MAG: hypothetical protein STHCBS139747_001805 [Sporothrix thermara]
MTRIIVLAGAPDAASLDWSTLDLEPTSSFAKELRDWQDRGDSSTNAGDKSSSFDHPQWRIIPPAATVNGERSLHPEAGKAALADSLYGPAKFVALTPATQESTQRSAQDGGILWPTASLKQPTMSFDESSLSINLPHALSEAAPEAAPEGARALARLPQQPSTLPYQTADAYVDTTTTSQEFLEYSLAVHDALPSSMPEVDLLEARGTDASFDDETTLSFSESTSFFLHPTLPPLPVDIPRWQPLTNLVDVPSAAYLLSLAPQTVTVNLVVAIVSVGVPRVIDGGNRDRNNNSNNPGRRDRPPASLVELVVGDETRSGFGLTIWMDGGGQYPDSTSTLARLLSTLAPHDVVLLRHIALHVFGDKVYGSSLRKDQTKMYVLHRGGRLMRRRQLEEPGGDALFSSAHLAAAARLGTTEDDAGPSTGWRLLKKTAIVRDWALQYVIVNGHQVGCAEEGSEHDTRFETAPRTWMMPPPDTQ